jgi:hypothetical protein
MLQLPLTNGIYDEWQMMATEEKIVKLVPQLYCRMFRIIAKKED